MICKTCKGKKGWWAKSYRNATVDISTGKVLVADSIERVFVKCPDCKGKGTKP